MPLKPGKSKKVVSSNIRELVSSFEKKGSIGTYHPASKEDAIKQAVAISLKRARKSRK